MVSDGYGTSKDLSDYPGPGEHSNRKTATIITMAGGGTSYHADCPYCGKSQLLNKQLFTMWTCCRECGKTYNLKYSNNSEIKVNGTDKQDEVVSDEIAPKDKPFIPPPATPRIPDYERGDSRRGPRNWPMY